MKKWKEIIEEIYSTPRSRKYKYHKNHRKHLHIDSMLFSDFIISTNKLKGKCKSG